MLATRIMLRTITPIIVFLLLAPVVQAASNEYAEVTAYVNGQKVPPIAKAVLNVGEGFDVDVVIDLKKDATFSLGLSSPGKTQPFVAESGPSAFAKTLDFDDPKSAGERIQLKWRLKPTADWAGGGAPINLDVSFADTKPPYRSHPLSMGVANIYISPSGGAPAQAAPAGTPRQPGFEMAAALAAFGLVALSSRRLTKYSSSAG